MYKLVVLMDHYLIEYTKLQIKDARFFIVGKNKKNKNKNRLLSKISF